MGARQKGNRNRKRAIVLLESQGYKVDVVEKTGRFVKVKDCFGLWDLIAIKPDYTLFVQVASNTPHTHRLFQEFADAYSGDHLGVLQVVWIDYKKEPKHFWYTKA